MTSLQRRRPSTLSVVISPPPPTPPPTTRSVVGGSGESADDAVQYGRPQVQVHTDTDTTTTLHFIWTKVGTCGPPQCNAVVCGTLCHSTWIIVLAGSCMMQRHFLLLLPALRRGTLSDVAIRPPVCPSVCLPHVHRSRRCILGLWLLQNTNRKPHAGSRT